MVFQPSSLSLVVWDSGFVNVTSAFVQSTHPEGPAQLFFRVFSLCCSDWVIPVVTSSSSLVHSPSFSSSGPIVRFYFRYCFFLALKFLGGFVFISSVFAVTFFSFLFQMCLYWLSEMFCDGS